MRILLYNLRNTTEEVTAQLLREPEVHDQGLYLSSGRHGDRLIIVTLWRELPTEWSRRMKAKYHDGLKFTLLCQQDSRSK